MRLLTRLFLLLAVAVGAIDANAGGEIQGYIGNQSFRLSDDRELSDMVRRAEDAKIELSRAEQGQNQLALGHQWAWRRFCSRKMNCSLVLTEAILK